MRPRSCRCSVVLLSFARTYTVDLIHFLVFWRIYTVFLSAFLHARLVQPGGLAWRYRCVVFFFGLALSFGGDVFSNMIGVLHQRFSLVPCCQSKQYGWEWRRTVRLGRYGYMFEL